MMRVDNINYDNLIIMMVSNAHDHTEKEIALKASRVLACYSPQSKTCELKLNEQETITVPISVLPQLAEVLNHIAQGNEVKIVPIKQELTTSEAAEILNVSRPYLVDLLESGQIPFRKVGVSRRILSIDVMAYKQRMDAMRKSTLTELAAQAQELNMGYE